MTAVSVNDPGLGALLAKLRARDNVSAGEEQLLRSLPQTEHRVPRRTTIIRAGDVLDYSTILLEGIMCRYADMRDGSRQISEVHIPGDFVDLHSFTLKRLDHSLMSITPCRTAEVPHDRLREVTETAPHLTRLLWYVTALDAAIHREWVVSLGRRSAIARVAHFFCETLLRLQVIGQASGGSYTLGMTQSELAECMGVTAVHVNRTLKQLRDDGLVEFRDGIVSILDFERLTRVAEFDPDYLSIEKMPR